MEYAALVVSIVALCLALLGFALSYLVFRDQHRRRKLELTLELLRDWDRVTTTARAALLSFRDIYQEKEPKSIALAEIVERRDAERAQVRDGKLPHDTLVVTDHIMTILNYMEDVATACRMKLVDERYIRPSLEDTFRRWHTAFGEYLRDFRDPQEGGKHPWITVDAMMASWTRSPRLPEEKREPGTLSARR